MSILFLCPAWSQKKDKHTYPKADKGKFEEILQNPEDFTSIERTEIYLDYISKYLMTNPDTTFGLYQEMADYGKSIEDKTMTTEAYLGIAFMHQYQGNQDSNIVYLRRALRYSPTKESNATVMGAIGSSLMVANQLDSSLYYIDSSIHIIEKYDLKPLLAHAYLDKSELLKKQNNYHTALKFALDASKVAKDNWTELKASNTYWVISKLYSRIGDVSNAEIYLEKAIQICEANNYTRSKASYLLTKGKLLAQKRDYNLAISNYEKCIPIFLSKNMTDELIRAYSGISRCHLQLKQIDKSFHYISLAENLIPNTTSLGKKIEYLNAVASYKTKTQQYTEAEKVYQKILLMSQELGDIRSEINAHKGMKAIAEFNKEWKRALDYSTIINTMESDLDISNQKNLMYDLEKKYNTNLKNAEIQRLSNEKKLQDIIISRKNKQHIFFIIGLLLALAAIAGFYNAYRTKNKLNKELTLSLETNKMLIKEIHHRVKNNLQVVSSLLNIQSRFEKDDIVLKAINTGKYRVQSMSLLHQNLYVNEDLNSVKIKDYFSDLVHSLVEGYPLQGKEVNINLNIENIELDVDTLVPLGLIANEMVTNSLKYAYQENQDNYELDFSVQAIGNKIAMRSRDNGPGLPFSEIPSTSNSMGLQLIKSFAYNLDAMISIDNSQGAAITITFDNPATQKTIHAAS